MQVVQAVYLVTPVHLAFLVYPVSADIAVHLAFLVYPVSADIAVHLVLLVYPVSADIAVHLASADIVVRLDTQVQAVHLASADIAVRLDTLVTLVLVDIAGNQDLVDKQELVLLEELTI